MAYLIQKLHFGRKNSKQVVLTIDKYCATSQEEAVEVVTNDFLSSIWKDSDCCSCLKFSQARLTSYFQCYIEKVIVQFLLVLGRSSPITIQSPKKCLAKKEANSSNLI